MSRSETPASSPFTTCAEISVEDSICCAFENLETIANGYNLSRDFTSTYVIPMEERDFGMVPPNTPISDPYLPRINTVNLEPIQFLVPLVNPEEVHRRATLLQKGYSLDNNGFVEENLGLMSEQNGQRN